MLKQYFVLSINTLRVAAEGLVINIHS